MSARRVLSTGVIALTAGVISVAGPTGASAATSVITFTAIGATQTWTVPAGVTSVEVYAQGAQGGGGYGGFGAGVRATLAVTPNQKLQINVGGCGAPGVGGFNGGGGSTFGTGSIGTGQGGGGATDLSVPGGTTLIVAGGGGGQAGGPVFGMGGSAGGTTGEAGQNGDGIHQGGGGGTPIVAGRGGGSYAGSGSGRTGGNGGFTGGGGGGGRFGGGGGGGDSSGGSPGGGGAGSSYAVPSATGVAYVQGARTGCGQLDLGLGGGLPGPASSTGTFEYTGAAQLYQVPGDVTSINAELVGGQGGAGSAPAGFGADVRATVPVTPGQVLAVLVGGRGGAADGCGALSCDDPKPGNSVGGFNGGGTNTFAGAGTGRGTGGGGATDIRAGSWRPVARVVVAGGGGGSAAAGAGTAAGKGKGGDANGTTGGNGAGGDGRFLGGAGGTQSAGGGNGGSYAGDGRAGLGGAGGFFGGSGGGGWYGGGGGGGDSSGGSPGGGGAGSSYVLPAATSRSFAASTNLGDGYAIIGPIAGSTPAPTTPTAPPKITTVVAPSWNVVRYIHSFAVGSCANSVRKKLGTIRYPAALGACEIINLTHNPEPKATVASSDKAWQAYLKARDYRVTASIPKIAVTCRNGRITAKTSLEGAVRRFGYTPIVRLPGTRIAYHLPGDPYRGDGGRWNTGSPAVRFTTRGDAMTIDFKVSVAAIYAKSKGNALLLGRELPFVWFDLTETIKCSGGVTTVIAYSDTPSMSVYRGGSQVYTARQTGDWGTFFASATTGLLKYDPGKGVLDPACHTVSFFTPTAAARRTACTGPPK
jgi:glycine rich protein